MSVRQAEPALPQVYKFLGLGPGVIPGEGSQAFALDLLFSNIFMNDFVEDLGACFKIHG